MGQAASLVITAAFPVGGLLLMLWLARLEDGMRRPAPKHRAAT